jgi:glycosyltransferase 2 family protein
MLGAGISLVALGYFLHGIEWKELGKELAKVEVGWIMLAALILLGEFAIRALRWKVLLRPLGIPTRIRDLFVAQVIGAAANTLLPLRAGEIAKPLVASRRTGHPFATVVATAVMERIYDLMGMVSVLVLMVWVLAPEVNATEENAELVTNLKVYGGMLGVVAASCMAVFFLLASRKESARHIFAAIVSIAPRPIGNKFMQLFDGFVAGLANARDQKGLWQAGGLSILMWFNGALAIFCLFHAFSMELPFGAACFVGVAIALTVALPQAPGFMGVFHVAIEKTMILWGQEATPAQGFAIIFWAVSFLPVTLTGLAALWQEGLQLRDLGLGRGLDEPTPEPDP